MRPTSLLQLLSRSHRKEQTLASFNYQWSKLPDGDAMLSDPWFHAHVEEIIEQLTAVKKSWFEGKRVLDAGCGGGRWSVGLCRLGAEVTAVDFSESALERTRAACEGAGSYETMQVNLLDLPETLRARRFDMVYCFGVLHHTGNTFGALRNIAELVADDGAIFLYLYGAKSWTMRERLTIEWTRIRLAGMGFEEKIELLQRLHPTRDPHQMFDLLSPTINDRVTFSRVRAELERLGFVGVTQTVASGEVLVRATRPGFTDDGALLPGKIKACKSLLWTHANGLDAERRDRAFERQYWEIARAERHSDPIAYPVRELCDRIGIAIDHFCGKRVLVVHPDTSHPAMVLTAAGAIVTSIAPSIGNSGADGETIQLRLGSVLDNANGDTAYDAIFALGSSIALSRKPALAIGRLATRLAPGGTLIIETLAPQPPSGSHRVSRLLLKPWPFDEKIRRILRSNPTLGLAGAFARLSAGLPPRLSESAMRDALKAAGCIDVAVTMLSNRIVAKGRKVTR